MGWSWEAIKFLIQKWPYCSIVGISRSMKGLSPFFNIRIDHCRSPPISVDKHRGAAIYGRNNSFQTAGEAFLSKATALSPNGTFKSIQDNGRDKEFSACSGGEPPSCKKYGLSESATALISASLCVVKSVFEQSEIPSFSQHPLPTCFAF